MRRLTEFLRLAPTDRRLLAEAALALAVARVRLAVLPFRRIAEQLQTNAPAGADDARAIAVARRVGWAIRLAARHTPWKANCLPQALAGQRLLARRRVAATLYIGLARDADKSVAGHAWLRAGGEVIVGGPDTGHFTVVSQYPRSATGQSPPPRNADTRGV